MSNKVKKPQHIRLDHNIPNDDNLDFKDILLYAILLSYADKKTWTCYPSLDTLSKNCGMPKTTIRDRLVKLRDNGNITIGKIGRSNLYTLKEPPRSLKDREEFTMEFLKDTKTTPEEKALMLTSQHLWKNKDSGVGVLNCSITKLCEILKCGKVTCNRILDSLRNKGILMHLGDFNKEGKFGFNLDKIGQAVLFVISQVQENTEDITELKNRLSISDRKIEELEREILKLKNTTNI